MQYIFHNLDHQNFNELKSFRSRDVEQLSIDEIHLFYMKRDEDNLRLDLRKVINRPKAWVILVSDDKSIMELSWKAGVDFFIKSNSENKNLPKLLKITISKLIDKKNEDKGAKIRIKSTDRIDYIEPNDISYILGDGNYSKIYHKEGETLVSKNLKSLENSLSSINYLNRYGKSVILNTKKIRSIQGRKISFENGKSLEFPKYGNGFKDLKKRLLWKTV